MAWYDKFKEAKILIHQSSGKDGIEHNKFWSGYYDEKTGKVHLRWGRLGTKGQGKAKDFGSTYAAANFLNKKYREKQGKGYRETLEGKPIDKATLDRLHTEASIVGAGNKLTEFQWLEQVGEAVNSPMPEFIEINEDRLYDPACTPAIRISITTKKSYEGGNFFRLIFAADNTYCLMGGGAPYHCKIVDSTDPLHKLVEKVEEALGRRLSGAE
jgi:predicted DNA-binding WGR domain protein